MDKNTILDYATNSPENTNRNVLGSMLDQFSKNSGGGSLPEVTSEDNGDVLTVVNGEWAKAEPQGGGSSIKLYVTDPPATDPDLPELPEGSTWAVADWLQYGLSLEEGGDALTYSELSEIINNETKVVISAPGVLMFPTFCWAGYEEGSVFGAYFSVAFAHETEIIGENYGVSFVVGRK